MRLGHMLENGLSLLSGKGLLKNMKKSCMVFCEHCQYEKAHCLKFSQISTNDYDVRLQNINVWGPAEATSKAGSM